MIFKGIQICCPVCKGDLRQLGNDEEILVCATCLREFPVIYGIPDLRVFSDPYISIEEDRKKGRNLAEKGKDLTFQELIEYYYHTTSVVPPHHAKQYTRGLMGAVGRAKGSLEMWEQAIQMIEGAPAHSLLDLGCGTAPLLVAAARKFQKLVGIDIAFRWLIVGKKRLEEEGLDIPLLCACAEALPFPDHSFDRVMAESTVEHVKEQHALLAECQRVLKTGGYFFLSTPNRFSLGPDPHIGLWAGGWLPGRWIARYVQRQGGIPPKRHLLSFWSLRTLLTQAGFTEIQISLPQIADEQRLQFGGMTKVLIDFYHIAKQIPLSRELLYLFGHLFHAVCQKPPRTPSP